MDIKKPKHGGKRPGAGAPITTRDWYVHLAMQRARLTEAQALAREIENKKRAGELLERHAVEKSATLMHASMAQFLRGLPDFLERKCGLPADAVEALEVAVDDAALELAARIESALHD